jgi:lipopolysaccharide biosynthesis glycosyltransferase
VLDIVCAADERFAMPLAVMLRSAAAHCSLPMRVFVLNTELSQRSRRQIEIACAIGDRSPKIIWVDVDQNYLRDVPVGLQHLSQATYLRLAIGRLLPADVNRVIYLDSDVLVLKDLAELWQTPLDGNVIGAARDFLTPIFGQPNALEYCAADMGIAPSHPMHNAGILLIDVVAYRAQNIEAKCVAFLQRYRDSVRSADQDAINAVLFDKIKSLDFKWNVQVSGWEPFKTNPLLTDTERQALVNVNPAILHFSGSNKPWNSGLRSQWCAMFVDGVNRSGWYGQVGFNLWKMRRFATCVRTILKNKLDATRAG